MVLKWYETQISMTGVQITFGKEVDAKLVEKEKPDVVVLAPGSQFEVPDIPGIKNPNVVTTSQLKDKAKTYIKYLGSGLLSSLSKIHLPLGKRVIVVGGDLKGLEAAEFLVKRGKEVTIVDEAQDLGEGMYLPLKVKLLPWMQAKGVVMFSGVLYEEITPEGLTIIVKEGKRKKIKADTVLIIEKGRKNVELYKALVEKVSEIYLIGDAKDDTPRWFAGSIYDGARIGTSI
jgi:2,4-dienoyl-CoA reductase (NADPH2)